jgi:hypothetical protein
LDWIPNPGKLTCSLHVEDVSPIGHVSLIYFKTFKPSSKKLWNIFYTPLQKKPNRLDSISLFGPKEGISSWAQKNRGLPIKNGGSFHGYVTNNPSLPNRGTTAAPRRSVNGCSLTWWPSLLR